MTDEDVNKLRVVIKEEVNSVVKQELKPVSEKLDALWDQTIRLTEDSEEIKELLKFQKQALNQTTDNLKKVNKRLTKVETNLGIVPPPELSVIE